jgi:two-component system NtrC family sensor kinase
MVVNRRLIGLLNIGSKDNLQRFRGEEINFLSDLRRSAAIALSNSLQMIAMQESLRRWNEELEIKVEERTRQLSETQAQLVQAEKMATIGTLSGGIAHEINNPLTAVLTNAQILKLDARAEDREAIEMIEEGAKRCQVIIQKLMKYARKSPVSEVQERVDLVRVVHNVMAFLKFQLQQENIDMSVDGSGPHWVMGNANELEQVVTNLTLNSKDAIRQAGRAGRIAIDLSSDAGWILMRVSDNGTGISEANIKKIFDPFFTTKEVGKGTGLGLAVTYGIVEKHRGRIEVASRPGEGTVFSVYLPEGSIPPAAANTTGNRPEERP